jgi:hypothetical protein
MGANLTSEERDQFAIDLYNETLKAIQGQDRIQIVGIMVRLREQVINSDLFDNYALSCKLDLVLNSMIRTKEIEFASGFEGGNTVIGFSIFQKG